ncbi:MAG TPA: nucleotide disphospho-sugar-binding domain-containing protein, partial [Pirellulales bacterium]|nr:nucleotide disphospho-sugar-binding domain-containing protein [Pirellulales bacterium]
SQHESPVLQPFMAGINRYPQWLKRLALGAAGWTLDRTLGRAVNDFRARVGLPPVRHLHRWWCSPQAVVGFFPQWFARPQPDWPANLRLSGFPFYDETNVAAPPGELAQFIASGDPPLVFTPGSAMAHGRDFFAASVEACRLLKRRGILLTAFENQLPALPDFMRHFRFVPLDWLLPRAAAMIHHGGIGTTAQALRAGRPQLIMPMAFDQSDNAARLQRLGVARAISPRKFRGQQVARALHSLLESSDVANRCRDLAAQLQGGADLRVGCEVIESLGA